MALDFKALAAAAAASGANQTVAKAGGGDYEPPAAGPGLCRFVGYVEAGKQKGSYQGKPTVKEKVILFFELVGKRHPPREFDGEKYPHVIQVEETLSLSEKANFFKLFQRMNYKQTEQHMAGLLGEGFKCEVIHDTWKDKTGKDRVSAVLRDARGYSIAPPRKEDEDSETGWVDVAVPPATVPIKCFLWQHADMAQWGSIFIDGEYAERKNEKGEVTAPAKSKNVLQAKIKNATNFNGSPIYTLLAAAGQSLDVPTLDEQEEPAGPAEETPPPKPGVSQSRPTTGTTTSHSDALAGIV